MDIQLKTGCFDDAALVRRVVFMDEQGYENEFDAIDEDPNCIHVTLYVDGELAGCSRVFPEELERVADAEAPVLPACVVADWRVRSSRPVLRVHAMPALSLLSCMRRNTCCRSMQRRATRKLPR